VRDERRVGSVLVAKDGGLPGCISNDPQKVDDNIELCLSDDLGRIEVKLDLGGCEEVAVDLDRRSRPDLPKSGAIAIWEDLCDRLWHRVRLIPGAVDEVTGWPVPCPNEVDYPLPILLVCSLRVDVTKAPSGRNSCCTSSHRSEAIRRLSPRTSGVAWAGSEMMLPRTSRERLI